ncbi:hypothetical protein TherJR_1273 [Calderihabitans maritimus]|nr:hypothetical protein [Calderihabitans maritimus]GAW91470.1 hypothetical protein TherJR_1273 [Calderihabitans maritimus]
MALDEPKNSDTLIEKNGITFLVDDRIEKAFPEIHVDYRSSLFGEGFVIYAGENQGC